MSAARRLLVVAAAVAALATACTTEASTLDQAATQRAVGRALADQIEPKVTATTCPADLPLERGEQFDCMVELAGDVGTMPVLVTLIDVDGALQVVPQAALIARPDASTQAKASLDEVFGRSFQVDCGDDAGDGLRVFEPGETFECRARDRSSRRTITVTVVDAAGALTFAVVDEAGS